MIEVHRFIEQNGPRYAATKRDTLSRVDELRRLITSMEDFDEFPGGTDGPILFAILSAQTEICPDVHDFGLCYDTLQNTLQKSFEFIAKNTDWFGPSTIIHR